MNIIQRTTPHFGYPPGSPGRNNHKPIAVVHHVAEGTCAGADSWFANPNSFASTHYIVCKSGEIHQYVREEDAAYGNGVVAKPDLSIPWLKDAVGRGININKLTISIEREGYSHQPMTEPQIQTLINLTRAICDRWGIPKDRNHIIGHGQIDGVNRAGCPGPHHPWKRIMDELNPPRPKLTPSQEARVYSELTIAYQADQRLRDILTDPEDVADLDERLRRMDAIKQRHNLTP